MSEKYAIDKLNPGDNPYVKTLREDGFMDEPKRESEPASIEAVVMHDSAVRGMDILSEELPQNYIGRAADEFLSLKRGCVFLVTGFYVNGHPETDGPVGTWTIANAIKKLGFEPIVITDRLCEGIFEPEGISTVYSDIQPTDSFIPELIKKYDPEAMISIERCGRDKNGKYLNMNGMDISSHMAPLDDLFLLCNKDMMTIGIGDGGNEIGMGKVSAVAEGRLKISPCIISTSHLLIATVSNWACYGFCAYLEKKTKLKLLPDIEDICEFMKRIVDMGCVDGISGKPELKEDGYGIGATEQIISRLKYM